MSTAAPTRPLTAVVAAIRSGSGTIAEVERATGMPRDVVEAVLDHLGRLGRLTSEQVQVGCPATGCGSCLLSSGVSRSCPGAGSPRPGSGAVLMSLRTP